MVSGKMTVEEVDQLFRFLPWLAAHEGSFVERWAGGQQRDGAHEFPRPVYLPEVREFFELAAHCCGPGAGYDPGVAHAMLQSDAAIARAGVRDIMSMLTYCVRGERFCDGHWDVVLRSGQVTKLLCRLRELRHALE